MTDSAPHGSLALDATRVLTPAARHTGDQGEPLDFADFLASVLASVAANVRGSDRLLAGRSRSWEASYVEALIRGMVGEDPAELFRFRTEAVVVPLNVAELIESGDDHAGLIGLYNVLDEIGDRYGPAAIEGETPAYETEVTVAHDRYTTGYRIYGLAFATAVRAEAVAIGLGRDRVIVNINHDPENLWWVDGATRNPVGWDGDEFVLQLWSHAHDVVPLPSVDIRRSTHQECERR